MCCKMFVCAFDSDGLPLTFHISALLQITELLVQDRYKEIKYHDFISSLVTFRYASESIKLACKYAYKNATPGSTLEGISYFFYFK